MDKKKNPKAQVKKTFGPAGVTWPNRRKCWAKTGAVIAVSVCSAVVLAAADALFGALLAVLV